MPNLQNPPFIQNGFGSFSENPYSMLFNSFQNNVPSISANQANSEAMIMTLFQII